MRRKPREFQALGRGSTGVRLAKSLAVRGATHRFIGLLSSPRLFATSESPGLEEALVMSKVRTRFAPSPTGYMHIGGMRTAFFNWLWARHCGGQFILRIDDTDQARNQEAALGPILQAFRWLGLNWDEGAEIGGPYAPYYQSQRGDLYRAAAEQLEAARLAYREFATKKE